MSLLWLNGTLTDKADARVSPFDHGFLYGDGVWEPLRVFGGKLFRADDHLRILFAAAQAVGIDISLSQAELLAAIEATVKANNRTEGYVRVIVTRGPGTLGPDPRKIEPQVIVIAEEYQPFPQELYGHGLHAAIVHLPINMNHPLHRARTLGRGYWVVTSKRVAHREGCLEAIMMTYCSGENACGGCCTEGTLFVVSRDEIRWLMTDAPPEVAADVAAQVAKAAGYRVVWGAVDSRDILSANELFIAGTACGVIGIVRVDGRDIGTGTEGPVTRDIREAYQRLTRGEST